MTDAMNTTGIKRAPMDSMRKTALVAGVLYLITFAAGIPPAAFLLGPVLDNPNYIVSSGADTQVLLGAFLDLVNALACIGTRSRSSRWSNGSTRASRSALSPLACSKPPSSSSAS